LRDGTLDKLLEISLVQRSCLFRPDFSVVRNNGSEHPSGYTEVMNNARELLLHVFGPGDWAIEKPQYGRQKECYIASRRDRKVFIKFDLPIKSLQRLCDAGFAPRALSCGSYQGIPYVIQEYLDAAHPDREWIAAHVGEVAKLIKAYHADVQLTEILAEEGSLEYRDRLNQDLERR
jgi:hypothetical protein